MQAFIEKHFYLVNLAVFGLSSLLAGLLVTDLIEKGLLTDESGAKRRRPRRYFGGKKKSKGPRIYKSLSDVNRRNVFCSACKPAKVAAKDDAKKDKPSVTLDDAELLVTLVSPDDEKWSMATIRFKKTMETRMVAKDSKVEDAVITKVESKRVEFKRGGQVGYIELIPGQKTAKPKPPRKPPRGRRRPKSKWRDAVNKGIRKVGNNKYEIDRSLVSKFISNAAVAGRDAAIYPHTKNGKSDGFRLGRVRPTGIFSKMGFRNGDVIHSINNQAITSPDKVLELYTKLPGASHITIGISRRGKPMSIDYTIK